MREMSRLTNSVESATFRDGTRKSEFDLVLDKAILRSLRKRRKNLKRKNKNYLNDLRNLATIFTYSILYKRNVVFVTADSDAVALFFDWANGVSQQMSFINKSLNALNKNNGKLMRDVMAGKEVGVSFPTSELIQFIQGTTANLYSNRRKFFSPRLSIVYWEKSKQKFFEMGINLNHPYRQLLLHSHGQHNCPTTKNDTMGAFLSFLYH